MDTGYEVCSLVKLARGYPTSLAMSGAGAPASTSLCVAANTVWQAAGEAAPDSCGETGVHYVFHGLLLFSVQMQGMCPFVPAFQVGFWCGLPACLAASS